MTGWDILNQAIAKAREEVAAHAPDAVTAAEGEAYIGRLVANGLTGNFLGHLLTENGLGRILPTNGGPNPHYIMQHSGIDSSRSYRIEGVINGSERVGIGLYTFDPTGTAFEVGYKAFDRASIPADGRFTLDIGNDVPGALPIPPEAKVVLIRTLHRDPAATPARLRLTPPAPQAGPALTGGSTDAALGRTAHVLSTTVPQFLEWTRITSVAPNSLGPAPPHLAAAVQGDPDTAYFLGYYLLGEGEHLAVTMPEGLKGYWSLHVYNHWLESLNREGAHDANSVVDADGRIRIQVGPAVPSGTPNRLDTAGRLRGVLICRAIGSGNVDAPEARVVSG